MPTLDELLEFAHDHAADMMLGRAKEKDPENETTLLSSFVLVKENDHRDIIACAWGDKNDKETMIKGVVLAVVSSDPRVVAYSFLSECWTAFYAKGEKPKTEARLAPHRKEAVIAIASDGAAHKYRSWQIGRDSFGKCVSLTEMEHPLSFSSWMIDAVDRAVVLRQIAGEPIAKSPFEERRFEP